jgi:hypothetical protein
MEIQIHNFTGYESECEVAYFEHLGGDYVKTYYLSDLNVRLSIDIMGDAYVQITKVKCHLFDIDDNEIAHTLTDQEIKDLQEEMVNYVDWDEWLESQKLDE